MKPTESGTRARTRRAILDAAVRVLSHNPNAPMSDIASAAEVGRTTVHRYYPERVDLARALTADALEQIDAATARVDLDGVSPPEALQRLCQEYFELGELLMLVFNQPQVFDSEAWNTATATDAILEDVIARGLADGSLDDTLPVSWIIELMWAMLYTAWDKVDSQGFPKYQALELCLYSLRKTSSPQ